MEGPGGRSPSWLGPRVLNSGCEQGGCSGLSVSLLPWQVMLVIDAAVTNVEDLSSLEEYLAGLGRKHRAVGVKLSSFSVGKEGAHPLSRPPLSQSFPAHLFSLHISVPTGGQGWGPASVTYLLCDLETALTSLSLLFFFPGVVSLRITEKESLGLLNLLSFLLLCMKPSQTNNDF